MPPRESAVDRRRRLALRKGVAYFAEDFRYMCEKRPERAGIIAEGDSWFSYPPRFFFNYEKSNIFHHIESRIAHSDKVNLLRMSSSGDTTDDMLRGKQAEILAGVLCDNRDHIKLILFSGGGNDIAGKENMPALLNMYQPGFAPRDCINLAAFEAKIARIADNYRELIRLRDANAPQAEIITHSYDIAVPVNRGAKLFLGLINIDPWIYPYLREKRIPAALHTGIVRVMLTYFRDMLRELEAQTEGFTVVDTQGTLTEGKRSDWLNEIHPSNSGFKKIADRIYATMRRKAPLLP